MCDDMKVRAVPVYDNQMDRLNIVEIGGPSRLRIKSLGAAGAYFRPDLGRASVDRFGIWGERQTHERGSGWSSCWMVLLRAFDCCIVSLCISRRIRLSDYPNIQSRGSRQSGLPVRSD